MAFYKIKSGRVTGERGVLTFVGEVGHLFYSQDDNIIRISDGHTPGGIPLSGGSITFISIGAPPNPQDGQLWFDPVSGRLYVWFDGSWVDASPDIKTSVTSIIAGTGISVNTSTGAVTISATAGPDNDSMYATTATVQSLISNSLTNFVYTGTITYNQISGIPADNDPYTTTATVTSLIANSLTNYTPVTDRITSPNGSHSTYIDNTGATTSGGDILPGASTYNLGSVELPWKDVFVSKGSIVIADQDINVDAVFLSNTAGFVTFSRGGLKVRDNTNTFEIFELDNTGKLILKSLQPALTSTPAVSFVGNLSGNQLPTTNLGVMLQATGTQDQPSRIYLDGVGTYGLANAYPAFIGRAARGTADTPLPVLAGDTIARFGGNAYGNTIGLNSISNVRMEMVASETQSDTTRGTKIELWTTPVGSASPTRSVNIDSDGIDLSQAANSGAGITFKNGSLLKYWPDITGNANKILTTDGSTFYWASPTIPTGSVIFKGDWSAANPPGGGTPTISDGTGSVGWQWIVSAGGTQDLGSGNITFAVGDLVIHNGTRYVKIDGATPQVQSDWTETNTALPAYIKHKPTLATVATSGDWNDLVVKPSIPAAQVNSDWLANSGLGQILNKPSIVNNITTGTGIRVSTSTGVVQVSFANDGGYITSSALTGYATQSYVLGLGYTTTATVTALIANSLTNYATQTYVNSQGFITSSALSPYTTTATVNTLIANSLTNYATQTYVTTRGYITSSSLSVTTLTAGAEALTYSASTGVFTFTPANLSGYTTTATVTSLIANSLTNVVTSITAGTGTQVSTSTGAVTIWALPAQAITSTGTTTASNYTLDLSGPTFVHWQPSANGNRTITLSGFTPGRKVELWITPHATNDIFTVTGVTANQCSNGHNTFTMNGVGASQQNSFIMQFYCTTDTIGGVWIYGNGSL